MSEPSDLSIAPLHPREAERLKALNTYGLLGTQPEERFDEIVSLVAQLCGSDTALLSLVGEDLLWFKARYNYAAESGSRDGSFCSHALMHDDVMVIEDAMLDKRFNNNPLVTCQSTPIRFYAGAPLMGDDGLPLGVICAIDSQPKQMTDLQMQTLKVMANQIVAQMNLHRSVMQMQALNQSKDKFFAIIAHDLKAAFHGILGFSEVLDSEFDELDDASRRKIANYLNESSQSTYKLLDNLLEWARLENGSMPYRPKALQLDQLIEDTLYSLQFMAAQKNITLTTRLQSDIWLDADRHMLQSLVHNLVANALKFTPDGGVIQIFDEVKDDQIIISVQDNGTGMNDVQLQKLFDVAYSQSTTGTNGETGTGLGLLLCQQFVQQHKGILTVSSQLGQGSVFSFSLPLDSARDAAPQSLSA